MREDRLPEPLLRLIRYCLPSYPAGELLVAIAGRADGEWTAAELAEILQSASPPPGFVAETLALFKIRGLVEERTSGRIAYRPSSPELAEAVALLVQAFNERPVTLIRTIYDEADHPIQSFADAFRLKKDFP